MPLVGQVAPNGQVRVLMTNLLDTQRFPAAAFGDLYRQRGLIGTAFQHLAEYLRSEITSIGYPRAALFGFWVAPVAYTTLAVIKSRHTWCLGS